MEETKRRGRPARDENDTQSNLCTIKDPVIVKLDPSDVQQATFRLPQIH